MFFESKQSFQFTFAFLDAIPNTRACQKNSTCKGISLDISALRGSSTTKADFYAGNLLPFNSLENYPW